MKVLMSGISCSGGKEIARKIEGLDKSVKAFDIGEIMFDFSRELNIKLSNEKVLDMDPRILKLLRELAFQRILSETDKSDTTVLSLHLTFRWHRRLLPGFAFPELEKFSPDMYINVNDELKSIINCMKKDKWAKELSLETVNMWIDEEEFTTKLLADLHGKPFYLVPKNMDLDQIVELIKTNKKKAYLSYPITLLEKENPEKIKEIREFGNLLKKEVILFDPLYISDLLDIENLKKKKGAEKIEQVTDEAEQMTKDRVVARDFQFIDQSDYVIVYYPTQLLSAGVMSEIVHAYAHNKEAYAIYPFEVSPFLEYYCTRIFKTIDEFKDFLRKELKFQLS
jgi:adenylate kinase